jgi:hypothetical protein
MAHERRQDRLRATDVPEKPARHRDLPANRSPQYVNDPFAVELEQTVYALDSTTIVLCLSLFPWAKFRKRKAAVKLHTLPDNQVNLFK